MRTVGIDVAAQHNKTATCWIEWTPDGGATIDDETPVVVDDDEIRRCVQSADKAGIDIPLGWPAAFVEAVGRHHRHEPWQATRDALRLRATDRWVTERARRPGGPDKPGLYPLSVSTNLIGVPALRIAAALPPIDRSGSGRIVEVYPKAALFVWGLPFDGYKGAYQRAERENLISELRGQAPWLRGSEGVWERCARSDHYLDALVGSLVARAKACGLCDNSFDPRSEEAQNEGWIALPIPGSLTRLATAL